MDANETTLIDNKYILKSTFISHSTVIVLFTTFGLIFTDYSNQNKLLTFFHILLATITFCVICSELYEKSKYINQRVNVGDFIFKIISIDTLHGKLVSLQSIILLCISYNIIVNNFPTKTFMDVYGVLLSIFGIVEYLLMFIMRLCIFGLLNFTETDITLTLINLRNIIARMIATNLLLFTMLAHLLLNVTIKMPSLDYLIIAITLLFMYQIMEETFSEISILVFLNMYNDKKIRNSEILLLTQVELKTIKENIMFSSINQFNGIEIGLTIMLSFASLYNTTNLDSNLLIILKILSFISYIKISIIPLLLLLILFLLLFHKIKNTHCYEKIYYYLKSYKILKQFIPSPNEECAICYVSFVSKDETPWVTTPCNHGCCKTCADKWFNEHTQCPFCNQDIYTVTNNPITDNEIVNDGENQV